MSDLDKATLAKEESSEEEGQIMDEDDDGVVLKDHRAKSNE